MSTQSFLQSSLRDIFLRTSLCLTILGTLGSITEGRPLTVKGCGKRYAPLSKIVGGDLTIPGQYPWMVSLQQDANDGDGFEHICGASILNEYYIVTAAHCIDFPVDVSDYEVVVGLYSLKDKKPSQTYKLSEIRVHKGFDSGTLENDIALLRTAKPIRFDDMPGFINGICLPDTEDDPNGLATVTGWGDTEEGGNISNVLRAVTVPIVPRDLCDRNYVSAEDDEPMHVPETQICAGIKGKDSCQSDSGGPLIQKNEDGDFVLIGIVSYGIGCAQRKYPGVYTKVAVYEDWIRDRMNGKPEPEPSTTVDPWESTPAPQRNKTFSKILLYSSSFQSKLLLLSKK